jgi:hypothetical protein
MMHRFSPMMTRGFAFGLSFEVQVARCFLESPMRCLQGWLGGFALKALFGIRIRALSFSYEVLEPESPSCVRLCEVVKFVSVRGQRTRCEIPAPGSMMDIG